MAVIERKRPLKQFRVVQAYGPYRKGDLIQPTGMYRDVLVRRGLIEEVKDGVETAALERVVSPQINRMVTLPGVSEVAENLVARAPRRRER